MFKVVHLRDARECGKSEGVGDLMAVALGDGCVSFPHPAFLHRPLHLLSGC